MTLNFTIKQKLLAFSVLALTLVASVAGSGYWGNRELASSLTHITTNFSLIKNHLEADMMHDAIRGDVLSALHANHTGDMAGHQEAANNLKEHSAELPRNDAGQAFSSGGLTAPRRPSLCFPARTKSEGVKRREAPVRIAAPRGPPCGWACPSFGRERRPMTRAGTPFGASPRHFSAAGRAFFRAFRARTVSQLLAGDPIVPGRSPAAAREQVYETCPQGRIPPRSHDVS